jgi:hypothetical protein
VAQVLEPAQNQPQAKQAMMIHNKNSFGGPVKAGKIVVVLNQPGRCVLYLGLVSFL